MKLQYKFAGAIFGVGGVFLLAISVMYFFETREGDIHSQQLLFEKTAQERAEHISLTLKEKAHIASVLSRSHVVLSGLSDSNVQFAGLDEEKRRGEIKRLDDAWIHAKNEDDPFVRPYMTNAVAEFFKEHERAFPGEYGEIFLTNKYGAIIATTKKLTTLAHAHKYWWIATYNGGKGRVFFDDRGYDMSAKGYVIGVTVPVVKDGEALGILKCNHDVTATLNRIIESFRPGATGKLMIVRGKGKIVLAPGVKPLSADAPSTLVAKLAGRASGSLILNEGGVQTLTAYAAITMANGEGEYGFGGTADSIDHLMGNRGELWFVVISQSLEEAIAESYARTREIALMGVILIALMGVSAMYFGRRIALPVTRMEKLAEKIGKGDYDVHVDAPPGDEMGNLAVAFNQMAINLRTTTGSRDRLAEEVERRKEAEEKLKESEQRFRQLAEATFEGIAITESGRMLDANKPFIGMFGYENVEEVVGKNAIEFAAPEYREIVAGNIAAGYEKPYEIMGMRKDGSFFPIEIRARMMEIAGRRIRVTALRDITERKQAEDSLRRSAQDVRALLDVTEESLLLVEPDGVVIALNETAAKRFRKTPDEIVGKDIFGFMPPESAEVRRKMGAEAVRTRAPITFEDERNGRIMRSTLWPVLDSKSGEVAKVGVFSIDITQKRKQEMEIQENRALLRRTLDSLMDAVFVLDAATVTIKEVNKTATDMFGYQADEFIGKTTEFLHVSPEEIEELRKKLYPSIERDGYFHLHDFNMKRKDGSVFPTEITVFPLKDEQGRRVALVGTVRDISEVKKAEKALFESENKYRSLVEETSDWVWELNENGVFTYSSPQVREITGYGAEEILGKTPFDYMRPEEARRVVEFFRATAATRKPFKSFEHSTLHKDGHEVVVETSGTPYFSADGKFMGYRGINRDTTERKKAEEALQQKTNDVRALLDAAQESMFLMEVGGVVIALNETAAKRFGKTPDELVGKDMYDFMPPELAVVRRQREAEAIRNRSALTVEDERAGRFIRTTLWPVVDDKTGEVVRLAAFSIDITQRRKYEMEMQENRALLRRTLDSLLDAVFVLDAATVTVKEVNKAATDIFGYQTDELIGKTTEFLHVSPESLEAFRKELYPAIERHGYLHLSDFRMKRRDGSIFPTENSVFPLNDEQGRPVAWVSVVRDLSKVKEAEERFRLLFNSGSDAIFVSLMGEEAPGRFIEVNDIACQRLGYSREELLNMSPLDIDDSSQPGYTEDVARVVDELKSGHGVIFEQVHKAKDGRLIPVEINTRRFFYGGKVASLAIVRDITERKKAEEAMRESENRFRLVADSAPVLIWMAGTNGKCSYFNKGWLDFTGRPLEDEMGDGWAQGVHPHDRARLMDLYMAALEGRRKFSIEYRLWRKDGIYRWVLDSGVPRFSPSGDFIGYIGSAIDINDRKEAESALARSEKKIRDITAVIGQGVYALDAEGHLTFMNPEAERLLGWAEEELLGFDVHRRFHGKRNDGSVIKRGECPAHMALATGQTQLADGELLTKKDGGMFPASIVATPMMEEGRVAGVVVAFSDITERQRILREITEAKERAEEATKLKDKFVALVAHDLKSPFASIIGLLEVIKEDEAQTLDARNSDIMIHVLQSGRRMIRMIDELLDISRLKTGKIKPEFRFFDGSVLAAVSLARISHQAAGKGVSIANEVPAGTRLYADPNLFAEVLQNLLTNAVKFSEKGEAVTVFSPGEGIVAVKDMGVGIKKSSLPFLFRHEEKTTTPGTAGELGTGLGLPLSHDMMTALGGDLTVESEEGAGSVFYASLPRVNPVALIVDDQAPVRYLVNQHLIRIGVATMEAEDGEQALELIRRKRPHLVVTDIMMPKMSGFDLLEAIKKNPETASIPVMMITADNQVESREKSFRMGADDFVSKPIKPEDFIPRVRRFLG